MDSWVSAYLDGRIMLRDGTPLAIRSTLENWFEGARSAMREISRNLPVSPRRLIREIERCQAENVQGATEDQLLREALVWALREQRLAETAQALAEAAADFDEAAKAAGLSGYDKEMLLDRALERRHPAADAS